MVRPSDGNAAALVAPTLLAATSAAFPPLNQWVFPMNGLGLFGSRLKATARLAAGLSLVALSMTCGCGEEVVEKSPADIEKARQDHIEIMRRETGESATPAEQPPVRE